MRKLLALALAAAALCAPAYAQTISRSQTGAVGTVVNCTDPNAATIKCVLPMSIPVTSAGVEKGTTANPAGQNLVQVGGTAVETGAGTAGAGSARVYIGGATFQGTNGTATASTGARVMGYDGTSDRTLPIGVNGTSTFPGFQVMVGGSDGTSSRVLKSETDGALIMKPWAQASATWNYAAAASGITNTTTAVTIKAAAGASVRNYVAACQVSHDTLGGATELVFRDGASGTVLYRTKLQTTAAEQGQVTFANPLRGTANTLVEVATLTAVTGGVYVNCQGFSGN